MKFKNLIAAASLVLLPVAGSAATLIVPAAGAANGANGSVWKSELTLHNTGAQAMEVALRYHDQSGAAESATLSIPARSTVAFSDVVREKFGRDNTVGAIEITVADADANRLAVASRTFNVQASGKLGQDIAAVRATDALSAGDVAVISGPTSAIDFRFNAGIYTLASSTIRWDLIRANGAVAASQTSTYTAGIQNQFSVPAFLGATMQDNDTLHATVMSGSAIFYGSVVNEGTGDPSFVPGVRTREQARITLIGVDRDTNGSVDIQATDNTLASPVDAYTLGFPTFFRIVARGDNNANVTYEIISSTADARLIDTNGTVQMVASVALKGTTGELKVRATTADGQSTILTIPVQFF